MANLLYLFRYSIVRVFAQVSYLLTSELSGIHNKIMTNLNIKNVGVWGTIILIVTQVVALIVANLLGSQVLLIWALTFILAAALSYKGSKTVTEGFLVGIVAAAWAMVVSMFLVNGQVNYIFLSVIVIGSTLGGLLSSHKK